MVKHFLGACAASLLLSGPALAQKPAPSSLPPYPAFAPVDPGLLCRAAIRDAERRAGIPNQLMAAIGRIESGRPDAQGVIHPWPWTINVEGEGHIYDSKPAAIAAVRGYQAAGARSIDVGCMQVNLMFHPGAFASLDDAFDPAANARYAARFLNALFDQTHDWMRATAFYHSATPALGEDYQHKVAAVLPDEQRKVGLAPPSPPAGGNVWSTNVWSANVWNTHGPAWPAEPPIPRTPYKLAPIKEARRGGPGLP